MFDKADFFKKHSITEATFNRTNLEWESLSQIYNDFITHQADFVAAGKLVLEHLQHIKKIHSLRHRIKDPDHLVKKIIRKKEKDSARSITLGTYTTEITDLIGVRALHLYKDDWLDIHNSIKNTWDLKEDPIAYIREGDAKQIFEDNNCKTIVHGAGYRSVHYLAVFQPTKKTFIAEIQVRTVFEEGWSEIDHDLRYPDHLDDPIIKEHLLAFNRAAGNADEIGTAIRNLKINLKNKEDRYKREIAIEKQKTEDAIKQIQELKKQASLGIAPNSPYDELFELLTKDIRHDTRKK